MKWFGKKKDNKQDNKESPEIKNISDDNAVTPDATLKSDEPVKVDLPHEEAPEKNDLKVSADSKKKSRKWFGKKEDQPDKKESPEIREVSDNDAVKSEEPLRSELPEKADLPHEEAPEKNDLKVSADSKKKSRKWFGKKEDQPDKKESPEIREVSDSDAVKPENLRSDKPEKEALPDKADEKKEIPPLKETADTQKKEKTGIVSRLKKGLSRTRQILTTDIDELFAGGRKIDDQLLEELEERLITADVGVQTTTELMERITKKASKISDANQLKEILKAEILSLINIPSASVEKKHKKPHVIMVVGINGVGKTTTIGKLAAKSAAEGKKVLIGAADTFRAAAVEQLTIWAERAGADIVRHKDNADPAAVAYDAIEAAIAREKDIVFIDTAGRLHTKINLMEELKKIKRAVSKKIDDAPHEVLLVLDATTGQNALSQVKMFNDAMEITGISLAKLDGTAKGGIVINICSSFKIPLKYIGIGENIEDLQEFDPIQFVNAIF